jgi:hypothetical protein
MERKSGEEISLLVRDEQTERFLFNAKALQALGINPVKAQQRGYPLKEQSAISAEAKKDVQVSRRSYGFCGYVTHRAL